MMLGGKRQMYTLKIENVSKSYRKFQALHHIDLQIEKGLYGLPGPNVAGKTALMKILSTILPFKDGEVLYSDEKTSIR